jgi:hypothetical protein
MGKHTFDGLQFRILETLQKQPGQVPLTAAEIAERLHATEYRTALKDDVVFKVTRAVHAMKESGKIVVSDSRDSSGRLCYELPHRLKFPKAPEANGQPPVNPVLTPDLAAKIKTVEPKSEKHTHGGARTKGRPRKLYVTGIVEKILDIVETSPHPLVASDIVEKVRGLYEAAGVTDDERIKGLVAGNLYHQARVTRRLNMRRVQGYGQGIRYEYFTRRTGNEPHPLALKTPVAAAKPAPVAKPDAQHRAAVIATTATPTATPAPVSPTGGFRPIKPATNDMELKFRVPAEWNNKLVAAAKQAELTISEFMRQAVDYAISQMEVE